MDFRVDRLICPIQGSPCWRLWMFALALGYNRQVFRCLASQSSAHISGIVHARHLGLGSDSDSPRLAPPLTLTATGAAEAATPIVPTASPNGLIQPEGGPGFSRKMSLKG